MSDDAAARDPGLAGERTAMAWMRTALSVVAVGVLAARQSGSLAAGTAILVVAALAAVMMASEAERRHHIRPPRREPRDLAGVPRHVAGVAAVATALAACSAVIVLS